MRLIYCTQSRAGYTAIDVYELPRFPTPEELNQEFPDRTEDNRFQLEAYAMTHGQMRKGPIWTGNRKNAEVVAELLQEAYEFGLADAIKDLVARVDEAQRLDTTNGP